MNRDQLLQLQKDVEAALRSDQKRKRDDALRQMQLIAEKHGISLKDVLKNGAKTVVHAPKYRHPENPALTWSGRGRQPSWFKEAIDTVNREDLLFA
jgi:DNA-binding protein H-NS